MSYGSIRSTAILFLQTILFMILALKIFLIFYLLRMQRRVDNDSHVMCGHLFFENCYFLFCKLLFLFDVSLIWENRMHHEWISLYSLMSINEFIKIVLYIKIRLFTLEVFKMYFHPSSHCFTVVGMEGLCWNYFSKTPYPVGYPNPYPAACSQHLFIL